MPSKGLSGVVLLTSNNADGSGTVRGLRSKASAKLKIALFAPIASASESTATAKKAGCRLSARSE
jgi:hypothetical protein